MQRSRAYFMATVALTALPLVGCSGANGGGRSTEDIASSAAAITTSTILSRADEWVTARLLYCQSPNGADDSIDPSCPSVCVRESNSAWDPYRSDCSGFIAWSWGLPPPGLTTDEYAPADTSVSYAIDGNDLQPGDALNIPGDHVILFVSWETVGSVANFYEEPGCSATPNYAHAFTSAVTISGQNVTVAYEGMTFTAIRYTGITGDGGAPDAGSAEDEDAGTPCTVTTTGESGECMDTSVCAALGGHVSTPGYCPGPDDIQCCTALAEDAGSGGDGADAGPGLATSSSSATAGSAASTSPTSAGLTSAAGTTSSGGVTTSASTGGTLTSAGSRGSSGRRPASTPQDAGASAKDASGDAAWSGGAAGGCSAAPGGGSSGGVWPLALGALGLLVSRRRRTTVPRSC